MRTLRPARHLSPARRAFTLVEMLIVILIIAILMAFVLPRFFGARRDAGDRVAQQTLQVATRAAASQATDTESYTDADAAGLQSVEGDIKFSASAVSKQDGKNSREVSVAASADTWTATAPGSEDACWYVQMTFDLDAGNPIPTQYGVLTGAATCDAGVTTGVTWQDYEFPSRP